MRKALGAGLGLIFGGFLAFWAPSPRAQIAPLPAVISTGGWTLAQLTANLPPSTMPNGVLAITSDAGFVYVQGAAWIAATGFLPSTTVTMPTSLLVATCSSTQSATIANAISFEYTPNAAPGNITLNAWITNPGTGTATANFQYCTGSLSVTPSAMTITVKPFSR